VWRWAPIFAAFVVGCAPPPITGYIDTPAVDGGRAPDAGQPADGGTIDARTPHDAGFAPDATIDAGFAPPDAGFVPDAAPPIDAGLEGFPSARGYPNGTVIVHGGGGSAAGRTGLFFELVDDRDALVIVVPTAKTTVSNSTARRSLSNVGFRNVLVLHTRDPGEADTDGFVAPLRNAKGVWFSGGRQWRLADAYNGTRFIDELKAVLDRGGVIGGTSAGASIMGSFLIRGDTGGNTVLIGDHVEGFPILRNVGVDQHVAQRDREDDLFEFVDRYPDHLGLGLDEPIAAVFRGDQLEVRGVGSAYIHYQGLWEGQRRYLRLSPGDRFDIATLSQR